jgi:galacturonosyltransferase
MKIMFIGNTDLSIYNYRYEFLVRLLKDGHSVTVVSPDGQFVPEMKKMGCEHFVVEMERRGTNPFKDYKVLRAYKRIIKQVKPDYVLTYTIKPNLYGAMACKSLKVSCIPNVTGLGTAVENKGWTQTVATFLYKIAFKKVQTIFFQNEENMKFFSDRNLYNEKHKLLPGSGVNLERFSVTEYPDDDTVNFVFVSRLMKEKGIDQYLDAAEYITEKYPNTRFHICGFCEDEYKDKLESITKSDKVVYHGMVKDMTTVLCDMHCTVHPTFYPEGLSNVLLESLACGRPIITTDRAGCREVVDDGINGYIVKQRDSADLIEKIEKFIALTNEERKDMGLAGRAKVEREFDRNIIIERYLKEMSM